MVPQLRICGSPMPPAASRTTSQAAAAELDAMAAWVARAPMRNSPSTWLIDSRPGTRPMSMSRPGCASRYFMSGRRL